MNYLWEVLLEARQQKMEENHIRFMMAREYSAYMEVSHPFLNQKEVEAGQVVEVIPTIVFMTSSKNCTIPKCGNMGSFVKV